MPVHHPNKPWPEASSALRLFYRHIAGGEKMLLVFSYDACQFLWHHALCDIAPCRPGYKRIGAGFRKTRPGFIQLFQIVRKLNIPNNQFGGFYPQSDSRRYEIVKSFQDRINMTVPVIFPLDILG